MTCNWEKLDFDFYHLLDNLLIFENYDLCIYVFIFGKFVLL